MTNLVASSVSSVSVSSEVDFDDEINEFEGMDWNGFPLNERGECNISPLFEEMEKTLKDLRFEHFRWGDSVARNCIEVSWGDTNPERFNPENEEEVSVYIGFRIVEKVLVSPNMTNEILNILKKYKRYSKINFVEVEEEKCITRFLEADEEFEEYYYGDIYVRINGSFTISYEGEVRGKDYQKWLDSISEEYGVKYKLDEDYLPIFEDLYNLGEYAPDEPPMVEPPEV